MSTEHEQQRKLTVSARDLDEVGAQLARWLATKVDGDAPPRITSVDRPTAGGMSSTTVLFDAEWSENGQHKGGSFVARLAPDDRSFPIFESYDLVTQYQVMAQVAAHTAVPLPPLGWLEPDDGALGTPFHVMRRVDGRIPADNPPYVFLDWLFEASPQQRAELARKTVELIAAVHVLPDPAAKLPMLDGDGPALRRHVDWYRRWYEWAMADDGFPVPIIERGFAWLERHWPAEPGPDVLSWGDSRPGNVIYDGFTPVAALDWEMAALGPRELDVAWIIFLHRFFQDIATRFGQPGLPDFMRREDVVRWYQDASGHTLRDLDFYLVYAALRQAIVMARVKRRMIHFGEDTVPKHPDDYVMHRAALEALLDGTYNWD
ncbi:MAG: phosphotransferase family protein [Mycobacteriaceae bacterium]|nr:phosphotransferase family protein [Mycobacteriaceae bacterium]